MGITRVLKNMMMFGNGEAWIGDTLSVTQPKWTRKTEDYNGAGMGGPVALDMGEDGVKKLGVSFGGPMRDVLRGYGGSLSGQMLRFVGAYEQADTGEYDQIEIFARGRWTEIDPGEAKKAEKGEFKCELSIAYFRLEWNGRVEIEYDPVNCVHIVDGVDILAEQRAVLGV